MKPKCRDCGRDVMPDEEGLSMKLLGMDTEFFYCTECIAKRFGTTPEQMEKMILRFRKQGCQLFTPLE